VEVSLTLRIGGWVGGSSPYPTPRGLKTSLALWAGRRSWTLASGPPMEETPVVRFFNLNFRFGTLCISGQPAVFSDWCSLGGPLTPATSSSTSAPHPPSREAAHTSLHSLPPTSPSLPPRGFSLGRPHPARRGLQPSRWVPRSPVQGIRSPYFFHPTVLF